jgi:hypothetical protein
MRIAKEDNFLVGKWLVHCRPETADDVWEKIARATAMGNLGCAAKITPTRNLRESHPVICVYVKDSTDRHEVQRVLLTLRNDLGIMEGMSGFKPDVFTHLGIYRNNEWRLTPTLYNCKDVLAWDLSRKT